MIIEELFKKYSMLCQFEEGSNEYLVDKEDFETAMKEFAQHHVEQALKSAAKKVDEMPLLETERPICKDFILNSYPKENIK